MALDSEVQNEEVEKTVTLPNGKTLVKKKVVPVQRYYGVVDGTADPALKHIVKRRLPLSGKLYLPAENPWEHFVSTYMQAAKDAAHPLPPNSKGTDE
jgi:hypothetical protein